jgi:hypothetical protein
MQKIIRRIERVAGVPNLGEILANEIKPTDLQSLLLKVYRERVKRRTPRAIFLDYASNSFTLPSRCSSALLLEWDRIAFSHLPDGFSAVELSPVSPLGSVSGMAPVSQDWVLTTIRNTEVVADPTSVLAMECALRRQKLLQTEPTDATPVQLACSHRVVRTQRYRGSGSLQHFRLFSLCSAGRNTESARFGILAASLHIHFYLESLKDFLGPDIPLRVNVVDLSPDSHDDVVFNRPVENLRGEFRDVKIGLEKAQVKSTEYYCELRFKVYASPTRGHEVELVDGGCTDWTQKLLNNAKERLIISGIGSERLCEKFGPIRKPLSLQTQRMSFDH